MRRHISADVRGFFGTSGNWHGQCGPKAKICPIMKRYERLLSERCLSELKRIWTARCPEKVVLILTLIVGKVKKARRRGSETSHHIAHVFNTLPRRVPSKPPSTLRLGKAYQTSVTYRTDIWRPRRSYIELLVGIEWDRPYVSSLWSISTCSKASELTAKQLQ